MCLWWILCPSCLVTRWPRPALRRCASAASLRSSVSWRRRQRRPASPASPRPAAPAQLPAPASPTRPPLPGPVPRSSVREARRARAWGAPMGTPLLPRYPSRRQVPQQAAVGQHLRTHHRQRGSTGCQKTRSSTQACPDEATPVLGHCRHRCHRRRHWVVCPSSPRLPLPNWPCTRSTPA